MLCICLQATGAGAKDQEAENFLEKKLKSGSMLRCSVGLQCYDLVCRELNSQSASALTGFSHTGHRRGSKGPGDGELPGGKASSLAAHTACLQSLCMWGAASRSSAQPSCLQATGAGAKDQEAENFLEKKLKSGSALGAAQTAQLAISALQSVLSEDFKPSEVEVRSFCRPAIVVSELQGTSTVRALLWTHTQFAELGADSAASHQRPAEGAQQRLQAF